MKIMYDTKSTRYLTDSDREWIQGLFLEYGEVPCFVEEVMNGGHFPESARSEIQQFLLKLKLSEEG